MSTPEQDYAIEERARGAALRMWGAHVAIAGICAIPSVKTASREQLLQMLEVIREESSNAIDGIDGVQR